MRRFRAISGVLRRCDAMRCDVRIKSQKTSETEEEPQGAPVCDWDTRQKKKLDKKRKQLGLEMRSKSRKCTWRSRFTFGILELYILYVGTETKTPTQNESVAKNHCNPLASTAATETSMAWNFASHRASETSWILTDVCKRPIAPQNLLLKRQATPAAEITV